MTRLKLFLAVATGLGLSLVEIHGQVPSRDTGTCDYFDADGKYIGNGPCRSSSGSGSGEPHYSITAPFRKLFGRGNRSAPSAPAPLPADLAFDQAATAEEAEKWEEAEAGFIRALDLENRSQDRIYIYQHLSRICWLTGRIEDAIGAVREALRINPNDEWCRGQLANLLTQRLRAKKRAGDTDGIEEDYREALELAPDDPLVRSWAGWIESVQESQRAKERQERLFQTLGTSDSAGTGLTLMEGDPPVSEKPQPDSGGGRLEKFKAGNPPDEDIQGKVDLTKEERKPPAAGQSKAGDEARSAAGLDPAAGSEERKSNIARDVFDTAGKNAGSLPEVKLTGLPKPNRDGDPVVSDDIRKQNPKIGQMEQLREEKKKKRAVARGELAKIEEKLKTTRETQARGELLVDRAKAIQTDKDLTNDIGTINLLITDEIPKVSQTDKPKEDQSSAKPAAKNK